MTVDVTIDFLKKKNDFIRKTYFLLIVLPFCSLVEQNTDDILNTKPEKSDKNNKFKSQEDVEETVSKCELIVFFFLHHHQYINTLIKSF